MRTEELIKALAADAGMREPRVSDAMPRLLLPAVVFSALLFALTLRWRSDLLSALQTWRFDLKIALALALAFGSGWLMLRMARPASDTRLPRLAVTVVPAMLLIGVAAELVLVPQTLWMPRLVGTNALWCLVSIPGFALAPLVAVLIALRKGAPASPARAGAAAGLMAGALGAAIYGTHCWDDSPLFIVVWYTLAISAVAVLGALIGWRALRW